VCVCDVWAFCVCVWTFCITPRFGSRLRVGSGGELSLAALAVLALAPLAAVGANGGAPAILAVASDAVMLAEARARHTCVSPQPFFVLSRIGLREQGKGWSDGGLGVLKSESLPGSSRRDYFQRRQASSRRWFCPFTKSKVETKTIVKLAFWYLVWYKNFLLSL